MQKFTIKSSFKSLPIEIFIYQNKKPSQPTILLIKGLYGLHKPQSTSSWDNEIINLGKADCNFIIVNTARFGTTEEERNSKDAFLDKTFKQECDDYTTVFKFLSQHKESFNVQNFSIIANSFGGTILLGLPKITNLAKSVIMIGSGCGKSPTTTKPLLQTLYSEEKLLSNIGKYKGIFVYVRGDEDTIVPRDSQDKIIKSAVNSRFLINYSIRNTDHELKPINKRLIFDRSGFILSTQKYLENLMS